VKLDREAGKSIQRTEEKVYEGTGASSTRFRQENTNRGGCIQLCDGRSIVNRVWRWTVTTSSISLKVIE